MTGPKLTICIATYNRSDFISETLDSIIPQLTEAVELLVVDGASTDNTEKVMRDYCKRCNQVRYVRLPEKGGVDYDYNQAVELATGEYCWLFTDDDIIKEGGIQSVLGRLEDDYDLIIVNGEVLDSGLNELIEEKRLSISADKIYRPNGFDSFFGENIDYMSFIGCVVIRRSVWLERDREKYYGLEFIHLGVIFQHRFATDIYVIATPYISLRLGNAQWSSRAFEIWLFNWPELIWSFGSLADTTKAALSPKEPWRKMTKLMLLRAEGNYGLAEYYRFIEPRLSSNIERKWIKAIALLPGFLLNFLAFVYFSVKSPRNPLLFSALANSKYYYLKAMRQKRVNRS